MRPQARPCCCRPMSRGMVCHWRWPTESVFIGCGSVRLLQDGAMEPKMYAASRDLLLGIIGIALSSVKLTESFRLVSLSSIAHLLLHYRMIIPG
jgi:hypothetical protein